MENFRVCKREWYSEPPCIHYSVSMITNSFVPFLFSSMCMCYTLKQINTITKIAILQNYGDKIFGWRPRNLHANKLLA